MNKKFLSAILFGALMATSAGTFVSCKDYDDDIKNLQTQIDTNKTAIAELQKLVGAGNWVTNVTASGENLVVTMSNGTSATIAGIKGADGKDGKNAAEWTIGEDGFWYVDGEKTENVAVAKNGENGKNGATAPSPSISENGMWVVYSWDEAKGEFVAEETEIPAVGTSAYAVTANGVCTLYIADENGEMQEIALPATSDSFVIEAPFKDVEVQFQATEWTKWTAKASKTEAGKALLAKFPEIAEIEKNTPMKQGGLLPLFVTPAAVELTDDFSFQLQTADGKIADIKLGSPVQGFGNLEFESGVIKGNRGQITGFYDKLVSRSANEAGMWSLEVEPAYNEKTDKYAGTYRASLVAENAKGTVARTAFAYTVASVDVEDVVISSNNGFFEDKNGNQVLGTDKTPLLSSTVPYAEAIDLFATIYNADGSTTNAPVSFSDEYKNHYIIVVNDALDAEKYGLSIAEDGHTLKVAKMPEAELNIEVDLKVIALGLNGSIDEEDIVLTIGQEIAATSPLSDKEVTLGHTTKDGYNKFVRWNIADELKGFSATQLNQFLTSTSIELAWSYTNEDGAEVETMANVSNPITILAYTAKGEPTTSYKDAVTFGFTVDSRYWLPEEYDVRLTAKNGNTVVYTATAKLTVKNPGTTAIKLVPEFVEDGVLQVVGSYASGKITYNLNNGVILGDKIEITKFEDVDYQEYVELYGEPAADDIDMASENWIVKTTVNTVDKFETLSVNPYDKANAAKTPDVSAQLETVRNIRATYKLFENPNNTETFDFQVIVKSPIYSETPSEVVTIPVAKLTLPLTDDSATEAKENVVDIKKIASAVYAYGPKAGKVYNLWNTTAATDDDTATNEYNKLWSWKTITGTEYDYVANEDGLMVEIELSDLDDFGYDAEYIINAQAKDIKTYILHYANSSTDEAKDGILTWETIWNKVKDLTVDVEKTDADGNKYTETVTVFQNVESVNSTEAAPDYLVDGANNIVKLNTTYSAKYLKENEGTDEAKYLSLYQKYYNELAYNVFEEEYNVEGEAAKGLATELDGEAVVTYADEATGSKFAGLSGTTITARLASNVDMTTDEVVVPFKLTVKDKWGKTMVVPFNVTIQK